MYIYMNIYTYIIYVSPHSPYHQCWINPQQPYFWDLGTHWYLGCSSTYNVDIYIYIYLHNDRGLISQLMDVIAHVLTCSTCFHPSCTQSWYLDLGTIRWFYWVPVPLPVPLQATDFAAKECTEGRSAIDGSLNALKGRQMRRTVRTCSIGKYQRCPKNGGIKHWIKRPIFWTLMGHMMVDSMSFFMYPLVGQTWRGID
jgi:hypothetical protein